MNTTLNGEIYSRTWIKLRLFTSIVYSHYNCVTLSSFYKVLLVFLDGLVATSWSGFIVKMLKQVQHDEIVGAT